MADAKRIRTIKIKSSVVKRFLKIDPNLRLLILIEFVYLRDIIYMFYFRIIFTVFIICDQ